MQTKFSTREQDDHHQKQTRVSQPWNTSLVYFAPTDFRRFDTPKSAGTMTHRRSLWWISFGSGLLTKVSSIPLLSISWALTSCIETVITFAAPKEEEDDGGVSEQGDLRNNIYKDVNGDYATQCDDCFDFAALVVFHAVTALLDKTRDLNLQIFRIFEEYISILVGNSLTADIASY